MTIFVNPKTWLPGGVSAAVRGVRLHPEESFRGRPHLKIESWMKIVQKSKFYQNKPLGTSINIHRNRCQEFSDEYSNHLNTGLIWYLNGRFVSSCQMVWYLNGGLKTRLKKVCLWSKMFGIGMVCQVMWLPWSWGKGVWPARTCGKGVWPGDPATMP